MNPRRTQLAGPLAVLLGLTVTVRADEVVLIAGTTVKVTGGRSVRGTIQGESPGEVRIRPAVGADVSIPVDQIASVTYDNQPLNLTQAQLRESGGNLPEAAELYQKAVAEAASKPMMAQEAQFGRARVLAQIGQGGDARALDAGIAALDAFARAYPAARQIGPALDTLARLALQKGDFDAADRYLSELEKKATWAVDRAAVLKAKVLGRRGQHDQAVAALDRMLAGAPEGSPKWREATLAKSEALAGLRQYDTAESAARAVITSADPEDAATQALAYNTLGDCLRAAGKPKDALLSYLHTDILYAKDKEQHARALAQIAQVWRTLKQDNRADEALERLKQEYPQSPYLSAAAAPR
jgi:tetratricopeptide (TPR) repeat protein